jgi:hypothetical protein
MCYGAEDPSKKKRADLCSNTKPALDYQPSNERMTIMATHSSATVREEAPHVHGDHSTEKIAALTDIICCGGAESAAALFVLMGTLQAAGDPKAIANTAKHVAFTRCGELNVFGIVDAQIAVLAAELLAADTSSH